MSSGKYRKDIQKVSDFLQENKKLGYTYGELEGELNLSRGAVRSVCKTLCKSGKVRKIKSVSENQPTVTIISWYSDDGKEGGISDGRTDDEGESPEDNEGAGEQSATTEEAEE